MPEPKPIVATVVVLLVQVPPVIPSVNTIDEPAQTVPGPIITVGSGFTVIVFVTEHPKLFA